MSADFLYCINREKLLSIPTLIPAIFIKAISFAANVVAILIAAIFSFRILNFSCKVREN